MKLLFDSRLGAGITMRKDFAVIVIAQGVNGTAVGAWHLRD